MQRRHLISLFTIFALAAILFTGPVVPAAQAGVEDVLFGVASTAYLNDDSIAVVGSAPTADSTAGEIYVSSGAGALSNVILSGDKRSISASYTKGSGDTTVILTLAVHYGDDDTTFLQNLSFNVNSLAKNEDSVIIYIPGQIKHLVNGEWVTETTNRTVDTDNHTISVEVSSLSPFIAAVVDSDGEAAASSGGCFISSTAAPAAETGGSLMPTGIGLLAMMFGLGCALHLTITRFKQES